MTHYCRACDGEGAVEMSCSCHGKHTAFNCIRCGNAGLTEARCTTCKGSGEVFSWEEVLLGIRVKNGDAECPEDTEEEEDYEAWLEEMKEDRRFGLDF